MRFSIEELEGMPLTFLQNVDIQTKEEEEIIQQIVNKKKADAPIVIDLNITSAMTDAIQTPEDEAKLQAEIDAKKAESKAKLIPAEKIVYPSPEADYEAEKAKFVDPAEHEKDLTTTISIEIIKKPFCDFCNSKGVRHKKECTRLSANNNLNE